MTDTERDPEARMVQFPRKGGPGRVEVVIWDKNRRPLPYKDWKEKGVAGEALEYDDEGHLVSQSLIYPESVE